MSDWRIFQGDGKQKQPEDVQKRLPQPPSWRKFDINKDERDKKRGETFQIRADEVELVNAALYLRRPLLITGKPGTGKTSLAYAVAYELNLGSVLRWSITSRSTLQEGLYSYDAIGRLQDAQGQDNRKDIGKYIKLGPVGTALLASPPPLVLSSLLPRVLLIDEIDKSDINLPNDLLHLFEEGEFEIPELVRLPEEYKQEGIEVRTDDDKTVTLNSGYVRCTSFPFILLTSNGERDFPPAFLRRCLRLSIPEPSKDDLEKIVKAHLKDDNVMKEAEPLIKEFLSLRDEGELATDQLLNAIYLVIRGRIPEGDDRDKLIKVLLQYLI
jgi:MoxR-like ATPase